MSFVLRAFEAPGDYARLAELKNLNRVQPLTPQEIAGEDADNPPGSICHRIMAVRPSDGRAMGFAEALRFPNTRIGKFYAAVVTDPEARGKGAGAALLADLERFAKEHGGNLLVGEVRDTDPDSLGFAQRRGFTIRRHGFDSTLDLATFDPSPFAGVVDGVKAGGIRFFTMADEPGSVTEEKLYRLLERTLPDIPGYEASAFMSFDTFRNWVLEKPNARPDLIIMAADGDRLVGVTTLNVFPDHLYTAHTSVLPECRGRQIALALKLLSIDAARRYGVGYMRTGNDSLNGPMLAVNRKLGYVPVAGDYEVVKEL